MGVRPGAPSTGIWCGASSGPCTWPSEIRAPIYLITLPTGWEVVEPLARRSLVVNKADKFSTFPDVDRAYIASLEQRLLDEADHVLYVSRATDGR